MGVIEKDYFISILIMFSFLVPPKRPVIKDVNGEVLQRVAGPYNLGSRLILICESEGG